MIELNSSSIQIQPGSTINGIVAGFVDNGDDFTLNFSGGSAIVDTSPLNANQLGLNIGEPVNVVVAEFDGLEIDTGFITRPDGSIILGNQPSFTPPPIVPNPVPAPPLNPPSPPMAVDPITGGIANPNPSPGFDPTIAPQGNPIFGTVVGIVDNDEFFLDVNGTQVLVDADLPDTQFLGLIPGEQVNVVGNFDDQGFDAVSITRADGSPVVPNLPSTPIPPVTVPPVTVPPSPIVPIPPAVNTLFGTVLNTVDNDEFFLDVNGTQVLVDADLPDTQFLGLIPGEQVNVVGNFDDQGFDAVSITRADGSPVVPNLPSTPIPPVTVPPVTVPPSPIVPIPPAVNTLFGTVLNTVDNDEFFLDVNGTQVLVDADLPDTQFLGLIPGEQVNVVGNFDDQGFDAVSITRADGSPVVPNLPSTPIPPVTVPPVTVPPSPIVPIPPAVNTLFGTVLNTVDNDEFFLDVNGTQVLVDADLPDTQFLGLIPGEQVNVVGNFDDQGFDAVSITRADGSPVVPNLPSTPIPPVTVPPVTVPPSPIVPIPPAVNTLFGTVLNTVDNDEFFLDVNGTQVLVDADLPDTQFLGLIPGEQVNVVGNFDDQGFDAVSITRQDGSVINIQSVPDGDDDWDDGDDDWDDGDDDWDDGDDDWDDGDDDWDEED